MIMPFNLFPRRPAQAPADVEVAAPVERHPWLGENVQDWDNEQYEAVQVNGSDTRGATRGYYLRHRASQTIVGRIRPDRSK
jgi:hypothetical protein